MLSNAVSLDFRVIWRTRERNYFHVFHTEEVAALLVDRRSRIHFLQIPTGCYHRLTENSKLSRGHGQRRFHGRLFTGIRLYRYNREDKNGRNSERSEEFVGRPTGRRPGNAVCGEQKLGILALNWPFLAFLSLSCVLLERQDAIVPRHDNARHAHRFAQRLSHSPHRPVKQALPVEYHVSDCDPWASRASDSRNSQTSPKNLRLALAGFSPLFPACNSRETSANERAARNYWNRVAKMRFFFFRFDETKTGSEINATVQGGGGRGRSRVCPQRICHPVALLLHYYLSRYWMNVAVQQREWIFMMPPAFISARAKL